VELRPQQLVCLSAHDPPRTRGSGWGRGEATPAQAIRSFPKTTRRPALSSLRHRFLADAGWSRGLRGRQFGGGGPVPPSRHTQSASVMGTTRRTRSRSVGRALHGGWVWLVTGRSGFWWNERRHHRQWEKQQGNGLAEGGKRSDSRRRSSWVPRRIWRRKRFLLGDLAPQRPESILDS